MARTGKHVDPDEPLRGLDEQSIGVAIPAPLSKRLDILIEIAERAGHRAYRKDLVAALILTAPESEDELAELLVRYRKAKAGEAAVAGEAEAEVLELDKARPGRRPRKGA